MNEPNPFISYPCALCGKEFPTRRIRNRHQAACQQTEADAQERTQDSREVQVFERHVRASQMQRDGARS